MRQIQRLIYEDAFHVSGYMYPRMVGMSNKVRNYVGWPFYRYMWLDK